MSPNKQQVGRKHLWTLLREDLKPPMSKVSSKWEAWPTSSLRPLVPLSVFDFLVVSPPFTRLVSALRPSASCSISPSSIISSPDFSGVDQRGLNQDWKDIYLSFYRVIPFLPLVLHSALSRSASHRTLERLNATNQGQNQSNESLNLRHWIKLVLNNSYILYNKIMKYHLEGGLKCWTWNTFINFDCDLLFVISRVVLFCVFTGFDLHVVFTNWPWTIHGLAQQTN